MSTFQTIKGTFDILPDGQPGEGGAHAAGSAAWRHVEGVVREVMGRFHATEIRTPILEPTGLVARGVGAGTDIVQKEMFAFEREDTAYVLRPEVTAPVVRAYLQHRLDQKGGTQRLYYAGPCFRAEQPQKGRFRQFHQFGLELIGSPEPRADAECIAAMVAVYDALGLPREALRLRINTLGKKEDRQRYVDALRAYLEPHADQLTETSRARLEKNPLRVLDTKDEAEQEIVAGAPLLIDHVSDASRAHYEQVKTLLDRVGIAYVEDPRLVRGLDYYAETAFELEATEGYGLGAQAALGGGGRYDGLAEVIGAKGPVPAVGFAAGFERLFLALEAAGIPLPGDGAPDVFLVALGDRAQGWVFAEAQRLRAAGLRVGYDLKGRSMKAQMKEADRQGARLAAIVGDDELDAGQVQLRDMDASEQTALALDDLERAVRERATRPA